MTRKLFHFGLLGVVLATGTAAFSVMRGLGQHQRAHTGCASTWLSLSQAQCRQINRADPGFPEEAQVLAEDLNAQQQALIELIRAADSPDEALRVQALSVVDAHHRLMRRVVQRLLTVRRYTNARQGIRLGGLCAGVVACGSQGGGCMQGQGGQGMHGPGRGPGRGMGMGRGPHCGRLAPALGLTDAQQAEVTQLDPAFETEVSQLTQQLRGLHSQFAQNLADPELPDTVIQASLDELIVARVQMEQRTVEHVLRIRSLLSAEQQERLIGLSQRGCTRCGMRGQAGPGSAF